MPRLPYPLALACALLLCFSSSAARASDGVLEINQTCAAVGCFDGDAAGWPVEITHQGSYRLTSNLDVPTPGGAIRITSDRVTLDLNGFTIGFCVDPLPGVFCLFTGTDDGIEGRTSLDSTVRNGVIQGFLGWGVDLSRRARLHGLVVRDNTQGGVRVGANSLVESNRIAFNAGVGASLGLGTAWGGNVLTTNGTDVTGSGTPIAHNLCSNARCGRVEARRYYRTDFTGVGNPTVNVCATGYRLPFLSELTQPASLQWASDKTSIDPDVFSSHAWLDEPNAVAGNCTSAVWTSAGFTPIGSSCALARTYWCIEE